MLAAVLGFPCVSYLRYELAGVVQKTKLEIDCPAQIGCQLVLDL